MIGQVEISLYFELAMYLRLAHDAQHVSPRRAMDDKSVIDVDCPVNVPLWFAVELGDCDAT